MNLSPYGSAICNNHQFGPQMWGGLYPSPKMVSLPSSLCSLSVRIRTARKPKEIAEVSITSQGTRNGRTLCVCAQASRVLVHVCILTCACACAHVCKKGYSINSVSLLSNIRGHTPEVLMTILSTQQQHNNNNTTTSNVCPMNKGG